MTAKLDKIQDETQKIHWGPSMPGNKTAQQLPYFFDEVLAMRFGSDEDGNEWRGLMCKGDSAWIAKDRSNKLSDWEEPHLGKIIEKIVGLEIKIISSLYVFVVNLPLFRIVDFLSH